MILVRWPREISIDECHYESRANGAWVENATSNASITQRLPIEETEGVRSSIEADRAIFRHINKLWHLRKDHGRVYLKTEHVEELIRHIKQGHGLEQTSVDKEF